ncbi:MAG TPA: hypothetical protein VGX75_12705 [bacterium]|nr:hypothetical protein [bacterium]
MAAATSKRDLRFWAGYFAKLLAISYLLMRFILHGTRVLAYYFVHGAWRFF